MTSGGRCEGALEIEIEMHAIMIVGIYAAIAKR